MQSLLKLKNVLHGRMDGSLWLCFSPSEMAGVVLLHFVCMLGLYNFSASNMYSSKRPSQYDVSIDEFNYLLNAIKLNSKRKFELQITVIHDIQYTVQLHIFLRFIISISCSSVYIQPVIQL
jgi:hypothetical protein